MKELIRETSIFFERHWHAELPAPEWDFSWNWRGAVPNYLLGGLYALFHDEKLVYVGLGRSGPERGISARLGSHVLEINRDTDNYGFVPKKRWRDLGINKVATIGFPKDLIYLSPALEDFLINSLQPSANSVGK